MPQGFKDFTETVALTLAIAGALLAGVILLAYEETRKRLAARRLAARRAPPRPLSLPGSR